MRRFKYLGYCLLGLILLSAAALPAKDQAWGLRANRLIRLEKSWPAALGKAIPPLSKADLDQDGQLECLEAEGGSVHITDCAATVLWRSPEGWLVPEAFMADLTNDGQAEAVLLVWRAFRPWPIDRIMKHGGRINSFHDSKGNSCQVILIGWHNAAYQEVWAGSALPKALSQLTPADLDGDGRLELAALESEYDQGRQGGRLTVWRWQGFGFSLLDRQDAWFDKLSLVGEGVEEWLVLK